MRQLTSHPATVYEFPLSKEKELLHPEKVILLFEHGRTIDIGFLCYLRREPSPKYKNRARPSDKGRLVDLSSFSLKRAKQIHELICYVSDELAHGGRRYETVRDELSRFIVFMSWADENGYSNVLEGKRVAREAARAYVAHLWERVKTNAISNNSGARQQSSVLNLLSNFLEIGDLTRGINLLRVDPTSKESTIPPSEEDQAKVLSLCEALFNGLTELVLNNKPYPFRLNMPNYLEWTENILWVFPSTIWCMPPHKQAQRHALTVPMWGYDYSNGKLAALTDLQRITSYANDNDICRRQAIRRAKLQLDAANADPQNINRRQAGMLALNVFIQLFLAETAMNWAQVANLPWTGDFKVTVTRQKFRAIKWRANNRDVYFEIPVSFFSKFKRYLELRKYLLNEQSFPLLFFNLGQRAAGEPAIVKSFFPTYTTLQRIDPSLPTITSRQWRAAKSDWLIRNTDPATAAIVLQNTEKTVLASYAAGSETNHLEEMTEFLDKVAGSVVPKGYKIKGEISRAAGACSAFGVPHQIADTVAIQPDCKDPEGCLFCDKYRIHADEIDIRKLLSCRYCLKQTASLAGSEENFQAMMGPIFARIQIILNEVSSLDAGLITRITHEVEEDGDLDPYWASKLEMLMALGLIS